MSARLVSVTVIEVADPSLWSLVEGAGASLGASLGPLRRQLDGDVDTIVRRLSEHGVTPMLRWARREAVTVAEDEYLNRNAMLRAEERRVLNAARRHALDGLVHGEHAWDPLVDAPSVRALVGAGLIELLHDEVAFVGRYRLHPDLPPLAPLAYDLADAAMDETDDLAPARPGPVALLHDLASLAAAIEHVRPKRTHAGTLAKADAKRVSARLAGADLDDERWARAMRALEALQVVSADPLSRELALDLGLERTLAGDAAEAIDHLTHRLVERDLHTLVPAVRAALTAAGDGAVDELVFLELVREQHRDIVFPAWSRRGARVYPVHGDESPRPYDERGFEEVETPMLQALLGRLARLGLIRRAPGVFAATPDGRHWARVGESQAPSPIWVSSDLEILVPPNAVTPWERFQLERLGRCVSRDVVDRYRIERKSVETWLSTHDISEAIALLRRRSPGVPLSVEDALQAWTRSATRVVITRGVVVEVES
jgi:hypothetical protein